MRNEYDVIAFVERELANKDRVIFKIIETYSSNLKQNLVVQDEKKMLYDLRGDHAVSLLESLIEEKGFSWSIDHSRKEVSFYMNRVE